MREISILLVRHGQSAGNVDEMLYAPMGDPKIGLTDMGWVQAQLAGNYLSDHYYDMALPRPPHIFISPYQRTKETFSAMAPRLQNVFEELKPETRVFENTRLIGQNFGLLSHFLHKAEEENDQQFIDSFQKYSKELYAKNKFGTQPPLGTSVEMVCNNVKSFIDGTLRRDIQEDEQDNFLIVTHGRVIQAFIKEWFHVPMDQFSKITSPGNCDIFEIKGSKENWSVTHIYDGEVDESLDDNPIKDVVYTTYGNLPKIPPHLKIKPE